MFHAGKRSKFNGTLLLKCVVACSCLQSVAAACGLSVCPPLVLALHMHIALVHTAVRRATLGCLWYSSLAVPRRTHLHASAFDTLWAPH